MWDDPKALNTIALALVACSFAAFIAGAMLWAARQPAFAIHRVVVRGELREVNPAHLQAVVRESLSGTFFTLKLESARAAFARVPWVRRVSVRRLWPDQLEVSVSEHVPFARWSTPSGEAALVDPEGDVFEADYAGELPSLSGPDGSAQEVSARYRAFAQALAPIGRSLDAVALSSRHGWQLQLDRNLVLALGRDNIGERFARFVSLYPSTIARVASPVDYVDMRYSNGFAARVAGFSEHGGSGVHAAKNAAKSRREHRSQTTTIDQGTTTT